jgi:Tol biopolymer transport system component
MSTAAWLSILRAVITQRKRPMNPISTAPSQGRAQRLATLAFAFGLAALLTACGGGGGASGGAPAAPQSPVPAPAPTPPAPGPGAPIPPPAPVPTPPAPSSVNPGYTGLLLFAGIRDELTLDLDTGISLTVRSASSILVPDSHATRFTYTGASPDDRSKDRLVVTGQDGVASSWFDVAQGLRDSGQLSPDGSRVLVAWSKADESTVWNPSVFDLQGNVLARYMDYPSYAWMPDGGLLLARGDSIYRVGADLGTPQLLKRFPGDAPGFLSPSPDGNRVAFGLGDTALLDNHMWVMNIDGTGLRQLSTSSHNEDGAAWSPDGKYLALRQGIAYTGPTIPTDPTGNSCPQLWIIPSDAAAPISLDPAAPAAGGWQVHQTAADGSTRNSVCAFSVPIWRAVPTALPASAGTPIAGLGGRMWADDASSYVLFDLSTGQPDLYYSLIDSTDADGLSPAGDEVVVSTRTSSSIQTIRITGLDGTLRSAFTLPQQVGGHPRLSPDGQTIAVDWNDPARGDPSDETIVTLFSRTGAVKQRLLGYGSYSWMGDGRLLLTSFNEIDVVDAAFTQATTLATFKDNVFDAAASPDGKRMVFTMASHVWMSGIDGSALHQLTVSNGTEGAATWSPDGKVVMLQHMHEDGNCPVVVAVPADGERVLVGQAGAGSNAFAPTLTDRGRTGSFCSFSQMDWTQ